MKNVKVDNLVLESLKEIKDYFGYKTLNETIDMCIGEFWHKNMPTDPPGLKDIKRK